MYDSPTYTSLIGRASEFTTLQINVFCERLYQFLYRSSGSPMFVKQVLQEMTLPEENVVNINLGTYAQQILFLSAMEDLRRDGLLSSAVLPEDIRAANTFRSSLIQKIDDFNTMNMSMRDIRFFRRDIQPLLGTTLKRQLLAPA